MINIQTIRKLRIGGTQDTVVSLVAASSVFMTNPVFQMAPLLQVFAPLIGGTIAGAYYWARMLEVVNFQQYFSSGLKIKSSKPIKNNEDDFVLGYSVDTGKKITLPIDDASRHIFVGGMSGVGKTVFGSMLIQQQLSRGGGLVLMDGKLDSKTLHELYLIAVWCGREKDLLVINPGDSENSNTYNPILYGDPDEVADRIVSLIPASETQAGADHYRQTAKQGITVLVRSLQKTGLGYTFMDLVLLLTTPRYLIALEYALPPSKEKTDLQIFLEQYKFPDKTGKKVINIERLKLMFGGITSRLYSFGTGSFGDVMNTTSPEVNLYEGMLQGKIIYIMMPTMGKPETASSFGKMVLGDARTAFSWLQKLPEEQKPKIPILYMMDELGSYSTSALARPFEQNRSARVILVPMVQTVANLEAVSTEFSQMVIGNTWTKVFFKPGTTETAEVFAKSLGYENTSEASLAASSGSGTSTRTASTNPVGGNSVNANSSITENQTETYKVSPDEIKELDKGEAIVSIAGSNIFHIKIPQYKFTQEFINEHPVTVINRIKKPHKPGINLLRRATKSLEAEAKATRETGVSE